MHVVEIRRGGDGLAGPMSQIRTWLDGRGIEALDFQLSLIPAGTVIRVSFERRNEAAAFARAFSGKLILAPGHPLAA